MLDENHILVTGYNGKYELWEFSISRKIRGERVSSTVGGRWKGNKKLLCSGKVGFMSNPQVIPLSQKEELEATKKFSEQLWDQDLPIPREITDIIVRFI